MNRTLYQLAYRNIKKYRKYYILVCVLIFMTSLFYNTFMITQKSYFQVNRRYNEEKYGYWYVAGTIEDPIGFDRIAKTYEHDDNDRFLYAYLYDQGKTISGLRVGYVTKNFYNVCGNKIIQGDLPKNKNEIAITKEVFEENGYQLNQTIHIKSKISEDTQFQIVGVIQNSQEQYFPDIYTAIDNQYESIHIFSDREIDYSDQHEYMITIQDTNEYSYNHAPTYAGYLESQMNLAFLLEGILLIAFVLIALTSISLKKRTQEFALLRGIGMTTRQMILMTLYEYMLCTFIATILGTIVSIGISYAIMIYIESQKNILFWMISFEDLCIYTLSVIGCIFIALLYPISNSSKQALSGTFEGKRFQYIQIRYRKLQFQNKWRLALRELKTNKKIHFFLIVILSFHFSLILMNQVINSYNNDLDALNNTATIVQYNNAYFTVEVNSQEDYHLIHQLAFDKTMDVKQKTQVDVQSYYWGNGYINSVVTTPLENIEELSIQGRLPMNDHEVLICQNTQFNKKTAEDSTEVFDLHLNDKLQLGDDNVEIVGILKPLDEVEDSLFQLYLFSNGPSLYVMPSLYQNLQSGKELKTVQIFYDSSQQREQYKEMIYEKSMSLYETIQDNGLLEFYKGGKYSEEIYLNSYILIMTFIACTLLCYVFNKYEMENRKGDYSLYQLIGMTKKDILKKQICKGIIVFGIIEVISLLMLVLECLYLGYWIMPISSFLYLTGIIFIICIIVYGLPLRYVLTDNPLDGFHQVD